ncbi:MAG: low specificity L-threonine aldolase [Phycisphaeraceae bacterium]|nr:low specificity L-threonine aldolase [Phycisphaeraceae bacterium]
MNPTTAQAIAGSQFASDNASGICPEAWDALQSANEGTASGYGNDEATHRASDLIRDLFEIDCEVFFCFNGTAANSMALAHICRSYHSVICHERSHIETDECGGPEFFAHGTKLLIVPGEQGKVTPEVVREVVTRRSDIHFPKPRVLSLTQATEMGTLYSIEQLDALREEAMRWGLSIHMDGARFANAMASLNVAPKEVTWKVGVDVLCFGGTKNGMPVGDAVVFFDRERAAEFDYRCKQAGQLASKMRFITSPWVGMLRDGAWLRHAAHANRCAARLASELAAIEPIRLLHPVQANAVFAELPEAWVRRLRSLGWLFYTFIGNGGARLMCSWSTTDADIDAFVADVQRCAAGQ